MGRKYRIQDQERFYFVTFTVVYWIDVFTRNPYKDCFLSSIRYCQQEKGLLVGGWCIMTNHIHLIVGRNGNTPLEAIIRDLKAFTARRIRQIITEETPESRKNWMLWLMKRAGKFRSNNRDFQFWQQHNHPVELNSAHKVKQRLHYIHQNPVKAGFVHNPEEWQYSSAKDYAGETGLIPITFLF